MVTSQRSRLGIVALFFIAAGLITLLIAFYQAGSNILVLKTWKPVEAQLLDVKVDNDKVYTSIQTARADNYLVTWTFRYNIGGATHVATADPGTHGTYRQMSKWADQFQKGQMLTIHHRPDNPDVISAAQWNWVTFSHAAWVGAWGVGITILGAILHHFSRRVTFYSYSTKR
jgi:hypothetical protein